MPEADAIFLTCERCLYFRQEHFAIVAGPLASGSMTAAVDRLEKKGLINRGPAAGDRRAKMLRLTEEGRRVVEAAFKQHAAELEAAMTVLNQGEKRQLHALVKKLGVTPKDNPFSQTLVKNGEAKKTELRGLSGAAFDRAYAQNELAYHQIVVKTVADQWIPSIQNAEFKKFMTDANDIFKAHLSHAQHVVDGLK